MYTKFTNCQGQSNCNIESYTTDEDTYDIKDEATDACYSCLLDFLFLLIKSPTPVVLPAGVSWCRRC